MTEHQALTRFMDELLRHETYCADGVASWGEIHDSRGTVLQAMRRWHAVAMAAELERYGPRLAEVVRLSVAFNERT